MEMSYVRTLIYLTMIFPLLNAGDNSNVCWLAESIGGIQNNQFNITSEMNQVKTELDTFKLASKAEFIAIQKKLDLLIQKVDYLAKSKKYVVYNLRKNQAEADTICNASGAALLSVQTEADLAVVKAQIKREINVEENCNIWSEHSGFWTSGKKTVSNEWRWATNGEVILSSLWQEGEPNRNLPCVSMWHPHDNRFGENGTLKLADEYCSKPMCFICQY